MSEIDDIEAGPFSGEDIGEDIGEETTEPEECYDCRGTGIGNPWAESRCPVCHGRGVLRR